MVFSQGSGSNVPNDHYLVKCEYLSTGWYREYSDGWIEQGGFTYQKSGEIKFVKPFDKQIVTFVFSTDAYWPDAHIYRAYASSLTGFRVGEDSFGSARGHSDVKFYYYATGY